MTKQPNRLSEEGRRACSEAGKTNIGSALEARRNALPALRQAAGAFEAALVAEVGVAPGAAREGLILSATASFAALFILKEKLLAARRFRRIETLLGQLTPVQGAFERTLRALDLTPKDAGDDPDARPRGGIAEYLERKSRETAAVSGPSEDDGDEHS